MDTLRELFYAAIALTWLVAGSNIFSPKPEDIGLEKVLVTPVATNLSLEERTSQFTQYRVCEGVENGKVAVFINVDEFGDFSGTSWRLQHNGLERVMEEPAGYSEAKWNAIMNPRFMPFEGESIPEGAIPSNLTEQPIEYGQDKIIYVLAEDAYSIFKFLKQWGGPAIDRLIISSHGTETSLGENEPSKQYFPLADLLLLEPEDFSGVMSSEGNVLLSACRTFGGYEQGYTVGEHLAYLLNAPVTGASGLLFAKQTGFAGPEPAVNQPEEYIIAHWYASGGRYILNSRLTADFVTVYPEDVRAEGEAHHRDGPLRRMMLGL